MVASNSCGPPTPALFVVKREDVLYSFTSNVMGSGSLQIADDRAYDGKRTCTRQGVCKRSNAVPRHVPSSCWSPRSLTTYVAPVSLPLLASSMRWFVPLVARARGVHRVPPSHVVSWIAWLRGCQVGTCTIASWMRDRVHRTSARGIAS